ncbi:MAG: hypothetical protein NVSMB57_09080 [Actinomycetota bacterium]
MRMVLSLMVTLVSMSAPVPPLHPPVFFVPPVKGAVLRHFEAPANKYSAGHRGLDLGATPGSTVVASAPGTVAFAGRVAGEWYVSIDHSDGLRTTYSFVRSVLVHKGDHVNRKSAIAISGQGHPDASFPPHLHFGMRKGSDYLDPEPYLVAGFRHDYADYVRLSAEPDSKRRAMSRHAGAPARVPAKVPVKAPAPTYPYTAGVGAAVRRRQSRRTTMHRTSRMRSLSACGDVSRARTGICLARSRGRSVRSWAIRCCCCFPRSHL